ncbi:MAG: hypothetical protein EOO60_05060, partial [Hymenobacter sp.]
MIIHSLLFYIENMQKNIYSPFLGLYTTWHRLLSKNTATLFASCVLLLLTSLANPAQATGFYKDFVIINGNYFHDFAG